MARSLAVRRGAFGRATLNRLGRPLATHAHREGHVIVTLSGGGSAIVTDTERLPLECGRALLIDSWRPHRFEPARGRASTFLTLYIEPEWFAATAGRSGERDALRFGASTVPLGDAMAALSDDLAAMLPVRSPVATEPLERILVELVSGVHDASWGDEDGTTTPIRCTPEAAPAARGVHDFRIRRAMRLLREAIATEGDADMDAVARHAGLSRPHFFKLFRAHVGVTPGTYLNTLKMERSYERLSAGTDSVTAIGLDLGFASQPSFTRFFIAHSGIAPSDYRRAVEGETGGANETARYA